MYTCPRVYRYSSTGTGTVSCYCTANQLGLKARKATGTRVRQRVDGRGYRYRYRYSVGARTGKVAWIAWHPTLPTRRYRYTWTLIATGIDRTAAVVQSVHVSSRRLSVAWYWVHVYLYCNTGWGTCIAIASHALVGTGTHTCTRVLAVVQVVKLMLEPSTYRYSSA